MTHHATARECWVKVKRGRPVDDGTFWYIDAVEEAMCFGWIDSTLKRLDGEAYQRFAPRTKGSLWSELNKERCRRMERLGRMTDMGRAALPDISPGGFTIDEEILSATFPLYTNACASIRYKSRKNNVLFLKAV